MTTTGSEYRLDGIYKQRQEGFYLQRVKLPAGVVSSSQARTVAAVSSRFGQGTIHLTTRGSMEIHWLKESDLPIIKRDLAKVGLTARGACGGAVRGITSGSQAAQEFPALESIARRLHRQFTGNPRFERLPKKFKIGIEASVASGRHLIQDVGLVLTGGEDGRNLYDVWIAGGLGREPRPGFLFKQRLPEERIIPVIEAIVKVYATHAPPPKRLKFLAREFGEAKLCRLIEEEIVYREEIPRTSGLPEQLVPSSDGRQRLELQLFAGKLTAGQLEQIADTADRYADGVLMITANQDIALLLSRGVEAAPILDALQQSTGLDFAATAPAMRVCPGSHECRMGLASTRDVATELLGLIGEQGRTQSWAISGCPNSCSQPQLADVGIVCSALRKDEDGKRTPRFDIYRRTDAGLGTLSANDLTADELFSKVKDIG
ncbi:nitrite/sulfite reductase [Oryzomonas sagensis]|nr:nitrite/sulfite reductase [Oryzomonas sagensis]